MNAEKIRNFSIIAHVDHGKSTLADRLLEVTGALAQREMQEQFLDKLELERERGITIKAQTVRIPYTAKDGEKYTLNLIDTPGHVDFHYEVSRSLAACEGALLVVDATQGVEAQTLANVFVALDNNLEILPVLNKIDLESSDVPKVKEEIEHVIGLDASNAIEVSAKTGFGVPDLLEAIVRQVPPPRQNFSDDILRAMIYDSWFDSYLGVVVQVRVLSGTIKPGDKIRFMSSGVDHEVYKLGVFAPHAVEVPQLISGEVGYFSAAIKTLQDVKIGDTVTHTKGGATTPLPGFKEVKPMVFGGLFPVDADDYEALRVALEKLRVNDSSFTFEPETSVALGFGFRCGYLGMLHMEIIQERLEREFELDLITTAPSVIFRVTKNDNSVIFVDNPSLLPPTQEILFIEEPRVDTTIHCPKSYLGNVLALCEEKRGRQTNLSFPVSDRAVVQYNLPLSEIVLDFHDRLKSSTKGYASFDYEVVGYEQAPLVKLDVMLNGDTVDALSVVIHRDTAYQRGKLLTEKLQEVIERQMFDVAIQAAIGNRIIARSTVKALRKNVTAKCYGGDITRKRKLLEKQKRGKKRMKQVGKVSIPQEAFLAVLKLGDGR
ncbi:MAG: translation elongation factor 4 [Bdellovibrionales bacterium]|nr:translation elongation factor 4 [Bdellovibrionales bacterium]